MRIAHVITRMIVGGAQENTLYNCQDLMRWYGDDVLLITGPAIGPEGDLLGQGRGEGVRVELLDDLRRQIDPRRDFRAYRAIRRAIADFAPDVVHTHSAKGGFLGRCAAASLGIPAIVHTVHGAPFHRYQGALSRSVFRWCERYAARRCHALISVADAMTDLLVEARVAPREKFTTIYSGMDVAPFLAANQHREATRCEFGFADEHVVFGKVARLFHLKGHDDLLAAASVVVRACPQVRFLLVGDGSLRTSLTQQIARAGLQEYFRFAGLVDPSRVPEMIGAMDALVHVSLREGLARSLPQALIAGKPVISYDIDGAREVVLSDETGFLIPPRDINQLSEAMIRLAGDRALRERLGQTGQQRFSHQFRHEVMTERIRAVYERVLAGKAPKGEPRMDTYGHNVGMRS